MTGTVPIRARLAGTFLAAAAILTTTLVVSPPAGAATSSTGYVDTVTSTVTVTRKTTAGKVLGTNRYTLTGTGRLRAAATTFSTAGCAEVWAQVTRKRTYFGQPSWTIYNYKVVKNWCWNDPANSIYSVGAFGYFTYTTVLTQYGPANALDYYYNGGTAHRSVRGQILKNCGVNLGFASVCISEWHPQIQLDVFDYGGWWYTVLSS